MCFVGLLIVELIALEQKVQAKWEKTGAFEADAATDDRPKFFVTFPRAARVHARTHVLREGACLNIYG